MQNTAKPDVDSFADLIKTTKNKGKTSKNITLRTNARKRLQNKQVSISDETCNNIAKLVPQRSGPLSKSDQTMQKQGKIQQHPMWLALPTR